MSESQLIYIVEMHLNDEGFYELDGDIISQKTLLESLEDFVDFAVRLEDENLIIQDKQIKWLLSQEEPQIVRFRFIVGDKEVEIEGTLKPTEPEVWEQEENKGFWFTKVPSAKG